jgi:hypothetical protein
VVSLTALPPSPQGKSPRYQLDRRLGGPQNRSGRCGKQKNLELVESNAGRRTRSSSLYRQSSRDFSDAAKAAELMLVQELSRSGLVQSSLPASVAATESLKLPLRFAGPRVQIPTKNDYPD